MHRGVGGLRQLAVSWAVVWWGGDNVRPAGWGGVWTSGGEPGRGGVGWRQVAAPPEGVGWGGDDLRQPN